MTRHDCCSIGFKEWSVICAALAAGRQALILRKGGIAEGAVGFRVAHDNFWLYPTQYHQAAQSVTSDAGPFLAAAAAEVPSPGLIRLRHWCRVEQVLEITNLAAIERLGSFHIWSPATVEQRFHYREPGLFGLIVRVYKTAGGVEIREEPRFAGCRSWVEFGEALPLTGVEPVMSDQAFADYRLALANEFARLQ
ncbi:MAG: DUF1802 family protein [Planctomycetaceae bacterium]|nr:DUF1802 family protein [Planctomycetaceae bacterium]